MAPFLSEGTDSIPHTPGKGPKYVDGALIPDVEQHGDNPVAIRLTDEEFHTGRTRPETIQQCLKHLHRDGFVVLENAIDESLVDKLYNKIVKDNKIYLSKNFLQYNQGVETKNVSQVPPLTPEWLSRDFYANVHMIRVVENIWGPAQSYDSLTATLPCLAQLAVKQFIATLTTAFLRFLSASS